MSPSRWARVSHGEAHGLRRGAWYPVVSESNSVLVILDVNKSNRPVNRANLEFSDERPTQWSVVRRSPDREAARRAAEASLGPVYGVCPNCRSRTMLNGREESFTCPECQAEFPVDWDSPC